MTTIDDIYPYPDEIEEMSVWCSNFNPQDFSFQDQGLGVHSPTPEGYSSLDEALKDPNFDYWCYFDEHAPCENAHDRHEPAQALYHALQNSHLLIGDLSPDLLVNYAVYKPYQNTLRGHVEHSRMMEPEYEALAYAVYPDVKCFFWGTNAQFNVLLNPALDYLPLLGEMPERYYPAADESPLAWQQRRLPLFSDILMESGAEWDLSGTGFRLDPATALNRQLKLDLGIQFKHCEVCDLPVNRRERRYSCWTNDSPDKFVSRAICSYGWPLPKNATPQDAETSMEKSVENAHFLGLEYSRRKGTEWELPIPVFMLYGATPSQFQWGLSELTEPAWFEGRGDIFFVGLGGFEQVGKKRLEYLRLVSTLRTIKHQLNDERIAGIYIPGLTWLPALAKTRKFLNTIRLNHGGWLSLVTSKKADPDPHQDQLFMTMMSRLSNKEEFPYYYTGGLVDSFMARNYLK